MTKILDEHIIEQERNFPKKRLYLGFTYLALMLILSCFMIRFMYKTGASASIYQVFVAAFIMVLFFLLFFSIMIGIRTLLQIGDAKSIPSKVFPDNKRAQFHFFCYLVMRASFWGWFVLNLIIILDRVLI